MQVRLVSASSPREREAAASSSEIVAVDISSGTIVYSSVIIGFVSTERTEMPIPRKRMASRILCHSSEIVGMKRNITDKGMISLFGRCIRSKESINSLTEVVFISSIPAIKIGSISLPSLTREKNSAAKPPLTFNDSVQSNRSIMRNAAVNFAEVFIRLFSVKSNAIRTKVVASSHRGGNINDDIPTPKSSANFVRASIRRTGCWAASISCIKPHPPFGNAFSKAWNQSVHQSDRPTWRFQSEPE